MKKLGLIILFILGCFNVQADCTTGFVAVPEVTSITVNLAGDITICWLPVVDASGIDHYAIYTINPITGATDSVDEINGLCYTLPVGHPLNFSDSIPTPLSVAAIDICPFSSLSAENIHRTIFLEDTFNVCSGSIELEWSAYSDFTSGTDVLYNVYVNINNGGYNLYASTSSLDTIYPNVIQGSNYEFYVEGVENAGAGPLNSNSNGVSTNTSDALILPTYNYLYSANVIDSTQISLQFNVDIAADINSYRIKRSTNLNTGYVTVGSVNAGTNPFLSFTDNAVKANWNSYYYKVYPVDGCGDEKDPYNFGRTILVDAVSSPLDAKNTVTITPYEGWENGVLRYELFRAVAGVWESSPVAVFPSFLGEPFVYEDDITSAFYGDGEFCYKVIAYEEVGNHVDGTSGPASSLSNEVCVLHEPILFIPSAFNPTEDFNPEFKPVLTFSNPESYFFQIYNKWGEVIFETNDETVGWNGSINNSGDLCQRDVYIYLIEFVSAEGEQSSKRGRVVLRR